MLQNQRQWKANLIKQKEITIDLKGVFVYPEVSCCRVTAIISIISDGSKHFLDFFMRQPEMLAFFCLLVLGSYRVELGLYEERKMYLKRKFCDSNESTLRQNDKMRWLFFLSFSCLFISQTWQFLPYNAARSNSLLSLTNVTDMWCNTVTDVYLT